MNSERCEFEEAITAAVTSGQWDDSLRGHLNQHAECAELEITLRCLASASANCDEAPLPAPGLIWWRAQLAERRKQASLGVAAIGWMQKAALVAAVIALISIWHTNNSALSPYTLMLGGSVLVATCGVLYGWARART